MLLISDRIVGSMSNYFIGLYSSDLTNARGLMLFVDLELAVLFQQAFAITKQFSSGMSLISRMGLNSTLTDLLLSSLLFIVSSFLMGPHRVFCCYF